MEFIDQYISQSVSTYQIAFNEISVSHKGLNVTIELCRIIKVSIYKVKNSFNPSLSDRSFPPREANGHFVYYYTEVVHRGYQGEFYSTIDYMRFCLRRLQKQKIKDCGAPILISAMVVFSTAVRSSPNFLQPGKEEAQFIFVWNAFN